MPTRRGTGIKTSRAAFDQDRQACDALALQVLDEVTVHAALDEGRQYPAARAAIAEKGLVDEAEVGHESVPALIEQFRAVNPDGKNNPASPRLGNAGRRNGPVAPGIDAFRSG